MRAIVTGLIASYPVGGVVWDYGQYALGLERLGWEVYYLEDTGWYVYDAGTRELSEDYGYGARFLAKSLAALSPTLGRRWHLRDMHGKTYGLDAAACDRLVASADLLLNVSGSALLRDAYMACPCKVLIDSDPGWNQFVNFPKWDREPGWQGSHGWRAHDYFLTYATRLGRPDCPLPSFGLPWQPTWPPVVVACWSPEPPGAAWTTVMAWDNFHKVIQYNGQTYGNKEREFLRVESLPGRTRARLEVAVGGLSAPRERWQALGWSVLDSHDRSTTAEVYRQYIQQSRGEFSVAKNVYAATRCGWFSCRSVCYLAAGRPVVVQDTGFSELIPTGQGLVAFTTPEEAAAGLEAVEADYPRHQDAARSLAASHFSSDVVLSDLLKKVGL